MPSIELFCEPEQALIVAVPVQVAFHWYQTSFRIAQEPHPWHVVAPSVVTFVDPIVIATPFSQSSPTSRGLQTQLGTAEQFTNVFSRKQSLAVRANDTVSRVSFRLLRRGGALRNTQISEKCHSHLSQGRKRRGRKRAKQSRVVQGPEQQTHRRFRWRMARRPQSNSQGGERRQRVEGGWNRASQLIQTQFPANDRQRSDQQHTDKTNDRFPLTKVEVLSTCRTSRGLCPPADCRRID
jgi:hypothetical protein